MIKHTFISANLQKAQLYSCYCHTEGVFSSLLNGLVQIADGKIIVNGFHGMNQCFLRCYKITLIIQYYIHITEVANLK